MSRPEEGSKHRDPSTSTDRLTDRPDRNNNCNRGGNEDGNEEERWKSKLLNAYLKSTMGS